MRTTTTLLCLIIAGLVFAQQPDDTFMDQLFDQDGFVRIDHADDYASEVLADSSQLVAAMVTITPSGERVSRIMRYNPDGTLDSGFGANGVVTLSISGGSISVNSMVMAPNGKIVLAGYSSTTTFGADAYFAVLLPDGNLDINFAVAGEFTYDLGGGDYLYKVVVDATGNIYAVGATLVGGGSDPFVCKLTAAGVAAAGFGAAGFAVYTSFAYDYFLDLIIASNGNLLAAGASGDDPVVHSIDPSDGTPVFSFATGGVLTLPLGGAQYGAVFGFLHAIVSGVIIMVDLYDAGGDLTTGLQKFDENTGAPDPTFDPNGTTQASLDSLVIGGMVYYGTAEELALIVGMIDGDQGVVDVVDTQDDDQWNFESGPPTPPPSPTFTFGIPGSNIMIWDGALDANNDLLFIGTATDTITNDQDVIVGKIIVGGFQLDQTVSVNEAGSAELVVSISPNPAIDHALLNVEMPESSSEVHVQILSMTGELVLEKALGYLHEGNNSLRIRGLEGLASGTYLVNIITDDWLGTTEIQKL